MSKQFIGLFGGTFDPIHLGHLHIARELLKRLHFTEIRFIPCKNPVHKKAYAKAKDRLAMLQLALANQKQFSIDTRELDRDTPSYAITTLQSLRAEFPEASLCFIVGADALVSLHTWHRWQELLNLCHIVAVARKQIDLNAAEEPIKTYVQAHLIHDAASLKRKTCGNIYIQPIKTIAISGTEIREILTKQNIPENLLPDLVLDYIRQQGLYQGAS